VLGGVISLIAVGGAVMLGVIGWRYGVEALVVGLGAALVPVPLLVLAFLWLDRYQPEPTRYLVFCFAWGACVATAVALGVNTGAGWLLDRQDLPTAPVAVLVAPFIEELGKVAAPLLLLVRRRAISGITDGIVYCGLSATGFAMVENILYLGGLGYGAGVEEFGPATGLTNLFGTFIGRILISGFAHPMFTAFAAIGIGLAARSASKPVRWLAPVAGIVAAMVGHGAWNLMATLGQTTGQALFLLYGYVAVMMPVFLGVVGLAIWLRAREGRLTQRILPDYVRAGWLSPPEVESLRDLAARHSARRWARRVAGETGAQAMRGFQTAATRLALVRDGLRRGLYSDPGARSRAEAGERALLDEIGRHRQVYVGRDPAVPPARWDGTAYAIRFPDGSAMRVAPPPEPVVPVPVPAPPSPPPPPPPAWPAPPRHPGPPPYPGPPPFPGRGHPGWVVPPPGGQR
jgi:RsiW-degrading membrane proteinase PrsW (M82 family)